MFTGLIEDVGAVTTTEPVTGGVRLSVKTTLASQLSLGDSLAVNGVCLTVVALASDTVRADVGPETLRVTTLGTLRPGRNVNLERPMRADSRFGGHFVLGHVDGVGQIESVRPAADFHWFTVTFPESLAPYFISKGSVAVDGISLTVAHLDLDRFDVQIVPFTLQHTNLQALSAGDAVNLECDMVGKYVVRAAALAAGSDRSAKLDASR
ncbi:MAG: riboflavin synthase [Vicinamibacterales bacterium]